MNGTTDDETILREVLERWRTAVDAHRPQDVADVFTEDAIFQGLHPYGVGRYAVAAYYASQPLGMRAGYRILETRRYADDLVLGYLDTEFTFTDRDPVAVKLAVLARRQEDGWALAHYQVSRL
ncbi:SgcJ/EcaC family oxidoreductase [Streptomyces sp. SS1-1]|uniref:SgcJ/EcaC family oxidoreductase n=1 Tax=Streptomyces sp. SS1-1 TaxID=2651869 RepID=UPI001250BDF3|nr:SgcJ/EcaC family oxidoreductase [Streptomyces sp. SS1-1]KAB2975903.1 SgcJ/EcaC family oxidoreductase [Streptomyces sp. SS1-1]